MWSICGVWKAKPRRKHNQQNGDMNPNIVGAGGLSHFEDGDIEKMLRCFREELTGCGARAWFR
jgi:hypothetical protein